MSKFIIISESIEKINNPFVVSIKRNVIDMSDDIVYLIHTVELAMALYDDFDFINPKIRENVYWFGEEREIDELIGDIILSHEIEVNVVFDVAELDLTGDVFYINMGNLFWFLNNGKVYHADLSILSKLHNKNIDSNYILESNFIGFKDIRVLSKEIGLLDEIYSEKHYIRFLLTIDRVYYILYHISELWNHHADMKCSYKIDNRYNNPYENILLVEEYLNGVIFNNIDIDKCNDYDLKYDRLPAKYSFSGFYSTTGRIYCSSELWTPLQNVQKSKRDILYAENGCILVEIDYKSFEFDILCQLVGSPIHDDPHTEAYNKFVGLPHLDARNIGKRINYSFIYGMNVKRLAESIINDFDSVPEGFKDTLTARFESDDMIIKARALESKLSNEMTNGVVKNYYGRSIHVKKEHAVLNNYISSTASDFIYNKFLFILNILSGKNKILLQNHDSILLQLNTKDIEETTVLEDILDILRTPISGISGRIEYKYGYNWRDLE